MSTPITRRSVFAALCSAACRTLTPKDIFSKRMEEISKISQNETVVVVVSNTNNLGRVVN